MIAETGRVALVTGAARGIGAATVAELCRRDYRVVAVDSCAGSERPDGVAYDLATPEDLRRVESRLPGEVVGCVADVRSRSGLERAAEVAIERFGRLDAVVAAAGVIAGGDPLWETRDSTLSAMWEVNALGVWNTAAVTVPRLLASGDPSSCRFVAVTSAAAEHGLFALSAYNASKHAVLGIVRGLAADLVGTGVTAVGVSPGSTRTAMLEATASLYSLADREDLAAQQQLRRLIEPEEIAATIGFCCSPEAAPLHGSVVEAEGGFGS